VLLNAVDCMLMTSKSEGSPQIVKEAIATGCPIVSVDVGDVKERISGLENCCIAEREPRLIAEAVRGVISKGERVVDGEERIKAEGLDNESVAGEIMNIYKTVIGK
ncbi:MAG: glycosyltransferase, partial [Paludibacteraceae bacterium]|nr:glycosyltransferase [Paludibacteraceae bacterium]